MRMRKMFAEQRFYIRHYRLCRGLCSTHFSPRQELDTHILAHIGQSVRDHRQLATEVGKGRDWVSGEETCQGPTIATTDPSVPGSR